LRPPAALSERATRPPAFSGLGLAIVREVAENAGGAIEALEHVLALVRRHARPAVGHR